MINLYENGLTKLILRRIMIIEKARPQRFMPKSAIKIIALTLGRLGDYFTFIVNTIKNTITFYKNVLSRIFVREFFAQKTGLQKCFLQSRWGKLPQSVVALSVCFFFTHKR